MSDVIEFAGIIEISEPPDFALKRNRISRGKRGGLPVNGYIDPAEHRYDSLIIPYGLGRQNESDPVASFCGPICNGPFYFMDGCIYKPGNVIGWKSWSDPL